MTISHRAKLIVLGLIVLIAVVLILLFLPRKAKQPTVVVNTGTNEQAAVTNTAATPKPVPVVTAEQQEQASAETVAQVFTERYGSYSSESEAANLEDVLPLTTASYQSQLRSQIARLQSAPLPSEYYGVTTKIISITVTGADTNAGVALFDLVTQREEAKGSPGNTSVRYQTISVVVKQEGDSWLVDSAAWK